jgi:HD superfamily phosphohydrolase
MAKGGVLMPIEISNTVFRDNTRDNRLIQVPSKVRSIVDTPVFQRLRRIRQMGLSSLIFPTAEHSRFAHSIGVYGTAREVFSALSGKAAALTSEVGAVRFDESAERVFCAAAMCHDLGHTAFSHVLENVLLPYPLRRHEACSLALLENEPKLRKAVTSYSGDLEAVILFIEKAHPNRALSDLISGPFDVDRADYLLRDSQGAGVHYGTYDFSWLLHSISVRANELHQPVILMDGPRGLDALRQFLAARRYMYRHIYFHPTIRSAQLLLSGIFQRLSDTEIDKGILNAAPKGLKNLVAKRHITLSDFIRTTDNDIIYFVDLLADRSREPVLKALASAFVHREFPKTVIDSAKSHIPLAVHWNPDEAGLHQPMLWDQKSILQVAREYVAGRLKAQGKDPILADYLVFEDRPPYRSEPLSDITFRFDGEDVPFDKIDHKKAGYNISKLLETFELYRLFAPRKMRPYLLKHLAESGGF